MTQTLRELEGLADTDVDAPDPTSVWFAPGTGPAESRRLRQILGRANGVAVMCWPTDAVEGRTLAQLGIPRLFIIDRGLRRPEVGPLQDWMLCTSELGDVYPRLVELASRAAIRRAAAGHPTLDCDGRLRLGDSWLELPAMVRRLAHRLLTCFGDPVGLGALASACFSSEATIEHRLEWLDRCVNPLGLEAVMVGDDACAMRLCASTLRLAAARP